MKTVTETKKTGPQYRLEREIWMELQEWWTSSLLLPIYREWLASALLRGEIVFADSGKSLPADKLQKFATAARFQVAQEEALFEAAGLEIGEKPAAPAQQTTDSDEPSKEPAA